jgi:hypothetical protein
MQCEVVKTNSAAPAAFMIPHLEILFSRSVETRHSIHNTNPGRTTIPSPSKHAGYFSAVTNNKVNDARSTMLCSGSIFIRSQRDGLKDGVPTLSVKPASASPK